jgi:hypothetical protein
MRYKSEYKNIGILGNIIWIAIIILTVYSFQEEIITGILDVLKAGTSLIFNKGEI